LHCITLFAARLTGFHACPQADGWYSWLHYTTDQLPSERNIMVPVYAKAREVTWMGQPKLAEGRCVGTGLGLGFCQNIII